MIRRIRTAGLLPLGAEDGSGNLRRDRAALPAVRPRGGIEGLKAPLLVDIIPALHRASGDRDGLAVRLQVYPRSNLLEQLRAVSVLEAGAHERPEHTEAPQRDCAFRLVVHGP